MKNGDISLGCEHYFHPIINSWNNKKYKPNYCHHCGQGIDLTEYD